MAKETFKVKFKGNDHDEAWPKEEYVKLKNIFEPPKSTAKFINGYYTLNLIEEHIFELVAVNDEKAEEFEVIMEKIQHEVTCKKNEELTTKSMSDARFDSGGNTDIDEYVFVNKDGKELDTPALKEQSQYKDNNTGKSVIKKTGEDDLDKHENLSEDTEASNILSAEQPPSNNIADKELVAKQPREEKTTDTDVREQENKSEASKPKSEVRPFETDLKDKGNVSEVTDARYTPAVEQQQTEHINDEEEGEDTSTETDLGDQGNPTESTEARQTPSDEQQPPEDINDEKEETDLGDQGNPVKVTEATYTPSDEDITEDEQDTKWKGEDAPTKNSFAGQVNEPEVTETGTSPSSEQQLPEKGTGGNQDKKPKGEGRLLETNIDEVMNQIEGTEANYRPSGGQESFEKITDEFVKDKASKKMQEVEKRDTLADSMEYSVRSSDGAEFHLFKPFHVSGKNQSEEEMNKETGHPTKHVNDSEGTAEGSAQSNEQQLSKDYADKGKEKNQSEVEGNKETGHPTKHENKSEDIAEGIEQSDERQLSKDLSNEDKDNHEQTEGPMTPKGTPESSQNDTDSSFEVLSKSEDSDKEITYETENTPITPDPKELECIDRPNTENVPLKNEATEKSDSRGAPAEKEQSIGSLTSNVQDEQTDASSEYRIVIVFGKYVLKDKKGKTVKLPKDFKSGPGVAIDKNYIKDDTGNVYEITVTKGKIALKFLKEAETVQSDDESSDGSTDAVEKPDENKGKSKGREAKVQGHVDEPDRFPGHSVKGQENAKPDVAAAVDKSMINDVRDEKKIKEEKDITEDDEVKENVNNLDDDDDIGDKTGKSSLSSGDDATGLPSDTSQGDADGNSPVPPPRLKKLKTGNSIPDIDEKCTKMFYSELQGPSSGTPESFEITFHVTKETCTSSSIALLCSCENYLKLKYVCTNISLFYTNVHRLQKHSSLTLEKEGNTLHLKIQDINMNIKEGVKTVINYLLEGTDRLMPNSIPTAGIDQEAFKQMIETSAMGCKHEIYACSMDNDDNLHCIYPEVLKEEADLLFQDCINRLIDTEISKTCHLVLAETVHNLLKDNHPSIKCSRQEILADNKVVFTISGPSGKVAAAEDAVDKCVGNHAANVISFKDIKLFTGCVEQLEEGLQEIMNVEDYNDILYYINKECKSVGVCARNQGKADEFTSRVKSLFRKHTIKIPDDLKTPEIQEEFSQKVRVLSENEGTVSITKEEKGEVTIHGLKKDVESASKPFEDWFKEQMNIKRAREQQVITCDDEITWTFPKGHCVVVTDRSGEKVHKDVIVKMLPAVHGRGNKETIKTADDPKTATLYIPEWKGGKQKEKETLTINVGDLLEESSTYDCFNIAFVVTDKSCDWQFSKLIKNILYAVKEFFEKKDNLSPTKVVFVCQSTKVLRDCYEICKTALTSYQQEGSLSVDDKTSQQGAASSIPVRPVRPVIQVVVGSIVDTKVDVIVNSIGTDLSLDSGAISKVIRNKAGPGIQKELKQKQSSIQYWQIVKTGAHNLKNFQMVLHCALGPYRTDKDLQQLETLVYKCLCKTAEDGFTSVVFPALGTGNLGYLSNNAARAMFGGVERYVKKRTWNCSIQSILFVMYEKDKETIKAFEQEYEQYDSSSVDPEVTSRYHSVQLCLNKMKLQAKLGTLKDKCADVMIYLWEYSHFKNVLLNDHPVMKMLTSADRQTFIFQRDSMKKAKKPFKTSGGTLAKEVIHAPCNTEKGDIKNTVKEALSMVAYDSNSVVLFFNQQNPLLKSARNILPSAVLEAVSDFSKNIKHSMDVCVLLEGQQNMPPFCSHFEKYLKASGVDEKKTLSTEPPAQSIDDRGDTPSTSTEKWSTDRLKKSPDMARYVSIQNVRNTTEEALKSELKKHIQGCKVALSRKMKEAIVICKSKEDATKLLRLQSLFPGSHKSTPSQVLTKFETQISKECFNMISPNKFMIESEFEIDIADRDDRPVVIANTQCQLNCTLDTIADYCKRKGKHISRTGSPVNIGYINVSSENVYTVLMQVKKAEIDNLTGRSNNKISFNDGAILFDLQADDRIPRELNDFIDKLNKMQTDVVDIDDNHINEARRWCQEIEKEFKGNWCVYDDTKHQLITAAQDYETDKKIKHRIKVKQGKVKVTNRGGRNMASGTNVDENTKKKADFKWARDASNVKEYTTKEGITVYVYNASIVNLPVDCIVNAANEHLQHGGGVAYVIEKAAGQALTKEGDEYIRCNGPIPVGMCCSTTAGKLPYKRVIHTVGPRWTDYQPHDLEQVKDCQKTLYLAIMQSFYEAEKNNLKTVALPAISSAIFGVPEDMCTYQYAEATFDYSKKITIGSNHLEEIHFIDINQDIIKSIQKRFDAFVNQGQPPMYDINTFVKTRRPNQSTSSRANRKFGPSQTQDNIQNYTPSFVEVNEHGKSFFYYGKNDILQIDTCDILTLKTTAVTCVINESGQGSGRIANHISNKIRNTNYSSDLKKYHGKHKNGTILSISGYKTGFSYILHVVIPREMSNLGKEHRKNILKDGYRNILNFCKERREIKSVALSHLFEDTSLSAEAFFETYLNFCMAPTKGEKNQLTVCFICMEKAKSDVVYKKFHDYAASLDHQPSQRSTDEKKEPVTEPIDNTGTETTNYVANKDGEDCVICMDIMTEPRALPCGHTFCGDCLEQALAAKQACPTCCKVVGIITGDQPIGNMHYSYNRYVECTGYPQCGTITITYRMPSGRQNENHPNPGKLYKGIDRSAYLPGNRRGNIVLEMLRVAFNRKLVFTLGSSRTTGEEGVITWNDIHHKTNPNPYGRFGYPDDTYLDRVTDELKAKGVTEKDIPKDAMDRINRLFPNHL